MSDYFSHPFLSNSDLKRLKQQLGMLREPPENLQAIFDFGTLYHKSILEPHLVTDEEKKSSDYKLAKEMSTRFWQDEMCRHFIMAKDFKREHEFYEPLKVGGMQVNARCKADGARTKVKFMLELKGLAADTQKAFEESLVAMDYDQACAHYLLTSGYDVMLIVAISKRKPERLFKRIVKKYDDWYLGGEQKLIDTLKLVQTYSPEDILTV
jgi:hypothetical protein